MRKIMPIFALLLSTTTFAQSPLDTKNSPAVVTIDYFLEACSVIGDTQYGMIPNFDCESYIYGILDTVAATKNSLKKPLACLPKNIAPWQVYEIITTQPIQQNRNNPAATFILKTLGEKYPCK